MTEHTQETIRTPLGRARGLGSAKDGTHHWWMQRVTAVILIPLCLYFAFEIAALTTANHAAFIAWMRSPLHAIAFLLFIGTAFYHAVLGIQVVIEDYVHHEGAKFASLLLNKIVFLFLGVTAVYAVIRLNFGL